MFDATTLIDAAADTVEEAPLGYGLWETADGIDVADEFGGIEYAGEGEDAFAEFGFVHFEVAGDSILDDRDEELVDEALYSAETTVASDDPLSQDELKADIRHKLTVDFHRSLHSGAVKYCRLEEAYSLLEKLAGATHRMAQAGTLDDGDIAAADRAVRAVSRHAAESKLGRRIIGGQMNPKEAAGNIAAARRDIQATLEQLVDRSKALDALDREFDQLRAVRGDVQARARAVAGFAIGARKTGGVHADDVEQVVNQVRKLAGHDAVGYYGADILSAAVAGKSSVGRYYGRLKSLP